VLGGVTESAPPRSVSQAEHAERPRGLIVAGVDDAHLLDHAGPYHWRTICSAACLVPADRRTRLHAHSPSRAWKPAAAMIRLTRSTIGRGPPPASRARAPSGSRLALDPGPAVDARLELVGERRQLGR
jgi:hypothetical protein